MIQKLTSKLFINLFLNNIQHDTKLLKSNSKDSVTNIYFQMLVLTLYQCYPEKMYLGFHKNIKQNNCFQHWYNTKKLFLSTKSVYQNDFWRIMWHWRRSMMLIIQLYYHRNKLQFKIYSKKTVILNCNNISQYYCFNCILIK